MLHNKGGALLRPYFMAGQEQLLRFFLYGKAR